MTEKMSNGEYAALIDLMLRDLKFRDYLSNNAIEALRMGAEALRAQTWQPIETAPKDGTHFLSYCRKLGIQENVWFPISLMLDRRKAGEYVWIPTHWMPRPAAPQPQGASK